MKSSVQKTVQTIEREVVLAKFLARGIIDRENNALYTGTTEGSGDAITKI
jgi:hypothetical protein